MVNRFTAVTAAMLFAASAATAQDTKPEKKPKKDQPSKQKEAGRLAVGDKAPALTVEHFIKGNKVKEFESGKVYVVEFWATWCGPCIASMPHLTEIQKEFKDKNVTVISVAASENGSGGDVLVKLKKFVQEKGDTMGYTVGYDSDKSMARSWMQAAGQNGIPCSFVVGKEGKVAWIGHPMNGLDKEIKKALAAKDPKKDDKKKDEKGGAAGGSSGSGLLLIAQPEKAEKAKDEKAKVKKEKAQPSTTLFVGDKAPELTVSKWVKGEPVTGFEKGKTYVVEFWATWCGPCKKSIPHLTELQKEYKDRVKFVGVSVWETDQDEVEPFVKERGDEMGYIVAIDDVPADGDRNDGKMAKNWMAASGQQGIPAAFIVNGEGKVAWIGHPNDGKGTMEKVLDQVLEGKYDLQKAAAEYRQKKEADEKMRPLQRKVAAARAAGDYDAAIAALDEIIKLDPKSAAQPSAAKFTILLNEKKDLDQAYAFGAQIVDGAIKDNAQLLNEVAWRIVDPQALPEKQDLKLALRAAQRASDLEKDDAAITDTLAKVYHDQGNLTKALELQEKAAKLGAGGQFEDEINERLAQYKEEAKKGK